MFGNSRGCFIAVNAIGSMYVQGIFPFLKLIACKTACLKSILKITTVNLRLDECMILSYAK
ncbi:hypothetical protein NEOC65_000440 [Neochlamydia sp. AcF65]|nr:hypothetical protein [Neochlamydia sp. AcF65]